MKIHWGLAALSGLNFMAFAINAAAGFEQAGRGELWCFVSVVVAIFCLYSGVRCADLAVSE